MKWVSDVIMWSLQTRIENCCSRTRILSPLMKVRQCKCKFVSLKLKVLFFGRLWHYCNMHCMFRCAMKFNSTRQNEAKLTARLKYFFKKRNSSLNRWKLGTTSTHEYKRLSSKQNGALKCDILEEPSESLVKWYENYFYIFFSVSSTCNNHEM